MLAFASFFDAEKPWGAGAQLLLRPSAARLSKWVNSISLLSASALQKMVSAYGSGCLGFRRASVCRDFWAQEPSHLNPQELLGGLRFLLRNPTLSF